MRDSRTSLSLTSCNCLEISQAAVIMQIIHANDGNGSDDHFANLTHRGQSSSRIVNLLALFLVLASTGISGPHQFQFVS